MYVDTFLPVLMETMNWVHLEEGIYVTMSTQDQADEGGHVHMPPKPQPSKVFKRWALQQLSAS